MVKPFFDRRVGWGIAGWRYLARMGLDRRIGHMIRAVHPKLGSACLVLGRNADLAREIASAPYPAGGNLPFGAVPARACNLPKDQAEGVRRMAVHRKYGCGIKDLAGRHRRLIKKQPAPVRLVCTQVVDAQLTHTAGQILQILRTVAVYGILSHCINAFFLPPCQSHADGHFLVFKHALNGHIRFNVIHLEDVLAVVHESGTAALRGY